ncbi:hypothetical protein DUNSADRAFT_18125 [Dunaliella salina]|nr:hypothetical protein DUNSADRAFT_18125 [Dunaliella salina]|eukprot:KAF5828141.1 hypothetical protein DUNSADRAFT_18125 [Dunaliella salina]
MRASSSAAELEEHGVQLLLAADAAGELQECYPLFHASVDALTLADVKQLLDQYKELVIKYECLARAVEEPHRTALALSQHPALPSTGTSFRDPASTFFATSTGVPLSLASTAQSTAASAAHPPPPPPPPANNAQQQQIQQQFQQASTSLAKTRHSSRASQDAPAQEHSPAGALHKQEAVPKAHEHHGCQQRQQQQQQQEHHQQQQQQQRTGGAETLGQPEGQLPQPSTGPKNEGKQSTQPWEQQPLLPGATQNRGHSTVSQVQHSQPAAPQPQEQQSPAPEDDVSQHLQQKEELGLKSRGHQPQPVGAQQGMGPSSKQPREELQTADDHSRQPLKDELEQEEEPQAQHQTASTQEQEGPQEQHQTAGAQEQKEPQAVDTQEQEPQAQHQYAGSQEQNEPQAQKQEEPEAQHQTAGTQEHEVPIGQAEGHRQQLAAAQQQAQRSPGQSENEHGQLAAAQQGACLPGEEDQTKPQTESTQAQDASQQARTVAWERSKMQQPPSLGSTQVIDVPPMTQTQSAQAQDAAQQAPSTVASERSTMQQPPSLGSTQVIDVPLMTQTESAQARDAAQQAPSTVASEPSTVQQDPVLGSSLVIDVPEMEQSIRNEAEEDGMQWRRCALYSMAPPAENNMRAEGGEVGSRSIGETEAKSMVHGDEDGSARGLGVLATTTQGEKKEQEQEQEQQQQQQGQDGDLLGGDVAFEQPCPFNSTQGSTFAGSSTVDAIIGQGVEHWMLGSMTQEGSNDATGASAKSAELGS